LLDLVSGAQALVENFRPGTLERLQLGPETLWERSPNLVIARVSGWGQTGPYAKRPGFGTLVEGFSGFAARNGYPDRPPLLPPLALADMTAGLYGAMSVLAGVRNVEVEGGSGQVIDVSLLEPIFSILGPQAANYELTGRVEPRTGNRLADTAPRNVYQTKDGKWLAISASTQTTAERLLRVLGLEEFIDDPRFCTNTTRVENVEELDALLQEKLGLRTLDQLMELFLENGITGAPVNDISQFIQDPHVAARDIVVEVPDKHTGTLQMHNVVPRFSETPGALRRPAPEVGEHTEEILTELGMSGEEIAELEAEGVL